MCKRNRGRPRWTAPPCWTKALEDRVEIIEAKTRTQGSPYYRINPSGRVPCRPPYEVAHFFHGPFMNLMLIVAILVIAAMPVRAQAQKPSAVTKADAQKVIKIINGDKAKIHTYCDIVKLGDLYVPKTLSMKILILGSTSPLRQPAQAAHVYLATVVREHRRHRLRGCGCRKLDAPVGNIRGLEARIFVDRQPVGRGLRDC